MAKKSKRFRALQQKHNTEQALELPKAVEVLKQFGTTKFDQTVEVAIRLGVDARQADQLVRGSVVLPHGIGKSLRVVVFAKGDKAEEAKAAGADAVGEEDLAKRMKDGWLDFDVCIAAPDMMGIVGPLGKTLGPKGLMPSPRAGTVTPDVGKTVKEYKAGKVEFRNDATRHRPRGRRQAQLRHAQADGEHPGLHRPHPGDEAGRRSRANTSRACTSAPR